MEEELLKAWKSPSEEEEKEKNVDQEQVSIFFLVNEVAVNKAGVCL